MIFRCFPRTAIKTVIHFIFVAVIAFFFNMVNYTVATSASGRTTQGTGFFVITIETAFAASGSAGSIVTVVWFIFTQYICLVQGKLSGTAECVAMTVDFSYWS